jgi:hypothetical protein
MEKNIELISEWNHQIKKRIAIHENLSIVYRRRYYWIGVPSALLAAIVTSGIFATFQDCTDNVVIFSCTFQTWIRFVLGIIGLISACLSALMIFFDYSKQSEKHKRARDDYEKLYRKIETVIRLNQDGFELEFIKEVIKEYNDIITDSPSIPFHYSDLEKSIQIV